MGSRRAFSPERLAEAWLAVWESTDDTKVAEEHMPRFGGMVHRGFEDEFLDDDFIEKTENYLDEKAFWRLQQVIDEIASTWGAAKKLTDDLEMSYFVEAFVIPVAGRQNDIKRMTGADDGGGSIPKMLVKSGMCAPGSVVILSNQTYAPEALNAFKPLDVYQMTTKVRDAFLDKAHQDEHLTALYERMGDLVATQAPCGMPDFGNEQSGAVRFMMGFAIRFFKPGDIESGLTHSRRQGNMRPFEMDWEELTRPVSSEYGVLFGLPAPWSMASEALAGTMFNHQLATLTHMVIKADDIRALKFFCQFQEDGLHFSLFHGKQYLGDIGIPTEVIKNSIRDILVGLDALFDINFMRTNSDLPKARVH